MHYSMYTKVKEIDGPIQLKLCGALVIHLKSFLVPVSWADIS